jgi:hypothetical protein
MELGINISLTHLVNKKVLVDDDEFWFFYRPQKLKFNGLIKWDSETSAYQFAYVQNGNLWGTTDPSLFIKHVLISE